MRILWENFTSFPSAIPVVRPEPRHITHTAHTHKTHIWNMKKKSKRITASSNAWWSHNIMFLCMATIRNILHAQRTCCRWRWCRAHWFQMHSRTFRINVSLCVCVLFRVFCVRIFCCNRLKVFVLNDAPTHGCHGIQAKETMHCGHAYSATKYSSILPYILQSCRCQKAKS